MTYNVHVTLHYADILFCTYLLLDIKVIFNFYFYFIDLLTLKLSFENITYVPSFSSLSPY